MYLMYSNEMPFDDHYMGMTIFQVGAPRLSQIRTCELAFSFLQRESITELVLEDLIGSHVYEQIQHSSPQAGRFAVQGKHVRFSLAYGRHWGC